jgi:ankyrin repeat protein
MHEQELLRACGQGNLDEVRKLLAAGADPNGAPRGFLPLNTAVRAGHLEVVKLLLERKADASRADFMEYAPLPFARKPEIAELLLGAGAPLRAKHPRGETGVHIAARAGDDAMLQFWLNKGLNIDESDAGGYTALHLAAFRGEADKVQKLIALGADPSKAAASGWTPLKSAESEGHTAVVTLLKAAGAR